MRELSDMLEDAKANPPAPRYTVEDAVRAGRRLRTRRRATWSGLAAAAAVVAVAGVVTVPRLIAGPPPGSTPAAAQATKPAKATEPLRYPAKPWEYAFQGQKVGEFTVNDPFLVTADFQQATVRLGDDTEALHVEPGQPPSAVVPERNLLLTVYRPGRYDPKQFAGGEPVTVGGKPGLFKEGTEIEGGVESPVPGNRGLAWQYAKNGWAVLNTLVPDKAGRAGKAKLVDLAAGLSGSNAYPATVAMKLGAVPPGYRLDIGGRGPDYGNGGNAEAYRSSLRLIKGDAAKGRLTSSMTDKDDGYVKDIWINLSTYEAKEPPPAGADPAAPYCNSGNAALCYRDLPGKYKLEIVGSGDTSPDELKQVLAGIQVADVDKPATWFPLASATP